MEIFLSMLYSSVLYYIVLAVTIYLLIDYFESVIMLHAWFIHHGEDDFSKRIVFNQIPIKTKVILVCVIVLLIFLSN